MTNADHRPPWPVRNIGLSFDDRGVCHATEPISELDGTAEVMPAKDSCGPLSAQNPAMTCAAS